MPLDAQFVSDYIAIRQLNAKYNYAVDHGDGEAKAALFTEDAEFHIVGNRIYKGREEIAAPTGAAQGGDPDVVRNITLHITTEAEIEITGDEATQRIRMLVCYRATDGSRNEFVASGWYIDKLKRTQEGWFYHHRRVELDLTVDKVFQKIGIAEAFAKLQEGKE